jgi:signal transduction histidine kinase
VAGVIVLSATFFCARPLGFAAGLSNSPAGVVLLCVSFLICYVLGYQNGVITGLSGVALLIAGLWVVNGSFSPVGEMITIGPWAGGWLIRSRRRLARQLKTRNDQLLAQREAYAAEAVSYERSRIAADLHDVVGHALSLMVVQATAGQRAGRASARSALEIIAEAARDAQADADLLAGLLSGDLARGPAWLDLTAELVRPARAAGVEVTYRLAGEGTADAASAEVVSRIVTEALTNALKHAPGAAVTVDISAAEDGLTVTVENGAPKGASGLAHAGGGYGLAGLRDRVHALGGQFHAGPKPDGGWHLHAAIGVTPMHQQAVRRAATARAAGRASHRDRGPGS